MSIGYAAGGIPRIPLNLLLLKNVTVRGMEARTWNAKLPEQTARGRAVLADMVKACGRP